MPKPSRPSFAVLSAVVLAVAAAPSPAVSGPGPAARPSTAPRKLTTVEGITEYALGNGMRVLLFPDASTENVTVNVTYLVGSRMEGYGETGMAHLLEHMLFKGSPKHPKVWEELKARGAANNASTWYDRTNYFETLPNKDDNLSWALAMEADRMVNANVAQADLAREFSVVRNEFEIGENDPNDILSERMWSTAYLWHNYGKSTIGSRADIEKVRAERLRRFYEKYYRPDNAVLVVAGKFDAAGTLATIAATFGRVPRPATPLEVTYTQEPAQDGERVVTLRRAGDVQVVGLLYHVAAAADPDAPAVEAIASLLADEPSGRLYQALVVRGLATQVTAYQLSLHDPGALEIRATVPLGRSIDVVRDTMIRVVEGVARSKITDAELARFKAKAKKQFKLAFANSGRIATALSEYIGAGDWRLLFVERDRVAALTTADVAQVAARYLLPSNRTLGTFVPTKEPVRAPLKAAPDVAKLVAGYAGKAAEAAGETFVATVANIEKRTVRSSLPSGLKVAVLAKQTRGRVVRAKLTMRLGDEAAFTGRRAAFDLLSEVLPRGSRKRDFQAIKDQWDQLEAQVSFSTTPGVLAVSIQTTRDNLAAVLALVDEILRQPSFPRDQFEIARKETLTQLEEQRQDPQAQAFVAVGRALSPYPRRHPLYVPTTEEAIAELEALRPADLRRFAGQFGMSNASLSVVGDVDAGALNGWLAEGWGRWKSPRPWHRLARTIGTAPGGDVVLDFPDKANALIAAVHPVALKDDDGDVPAVRVANFTLGGGGFVSRLLTRLRQQDGLSYFAFSQIEMPPLDAAGAFVAGGALAPANAKKGMAALVEEVARLVSGGVTAAELAGAKKSMRADFERSLSNDGAVLAMLDEGLYLGRTLEFWAAQQAAIAALTVDQVNAAIRRHLKPDGLLRITAGDKAKF